MRPSESGGELAFLSALRSRASHPRTPAIAIALGIGDDCAILRPPAGHDILVTTDLSLENRHFRRGTHPARSVGHRCLARGLSDLAAMGATPLAAFLSLALPPAFRRTAAGRRWTTGFLDGLLALAASSLTPLAGGDTSASPADLILADIVLVGSAPRNRAIRRSGARPGDLLYVTGALGGAAAELQALLAKPVRFRRTEPSGAHPHLFPQPRLAVGRQLLRRSLASAAIDLSDGLSTDLHHLCTASGVAAVVDTAALPLHPAALALGPEAALHAALHGGEDYELLFAAPSRTRIPRRIAGVPITLIGELTKGPLKVPQIQLRDRDGTLSPLSPGGWEHAL